MSFQNSGKIQIGTIFSPSLLIDSGTSGTININTGTTQTTTIGSIEGGTINLNGIVNVNLTTESTATTNGALIVDGGMGLAKNLYVGGNIHENVIRCLSIKATTQSIANATNEAIHTWTTLESSSGWTENTAGAGTPYWKVPINGVYLVTADINWTSNATGIRSAYFSLTAPASLSSTTPLWSRLGAPGSSLGTYTNLSSILRIATTDNLYLITYQTSTVGLAVPSSTDTRDRLEFSAVKISD